VHEALGNLKVVAIWFKRRELDVESKSPFRWDLMLAWANLKGMLHELACSLV